ncbi:hypothetical protein D3C81_2283290 [compost metagenome]
MALAFDNHKANTVHGDALGINLPVGPTFEPNNVLLTLNAGQSQVRAKTIQ